MSFQSADLRLYRNDPNFGRDTYISHSELDDVWTIIQAEINVLQHNLLDPTDDAATQTVIETGIAGDIQTSILYNTTQVNVDLVYKDIEYILFNVSD